MKAASSKETPHFKSWSARAPSNIALIKYMGKADQSDSLSHNLDQDLTGHLSQEDKEALCFRNVSLNSSLSYTLPHLITQVQIEEADQDSWSPFQKNPFYNTRTYHLSKDISVESDLSSHAQKRFLDFFQFLKRVFMIPGHYTLYSQNNYPMAIGAASSASSFAALTLAAYTLAKDRSAVKDRVNNLERKDLAGLSRVGSGSSCRSFFSPWSIWCGREVREIQTYRDKLLHQLVIVENREKLISSSEAHQSVKKSPFFKGRAARAEHRIKILIQALKKADWKTCFKTCYEEFLDLHSLFESGKPPIRYKTDASQKVLDCVQDYWLKNNDGPLVTMDAGANVHLLYRPDQSLQKEHITRFLSSFCTVLSSLESQGETM